MTDTKFRNTVNRIRLIAQLAKQERIEGVQHGATPDVQVTATPRGQLARL